jgi:hypothetical protein
VSFIATHICTLCGTHCQGFWDSLDEVPVRMDDRPHAMIGGNEPWECRRRLERIAFAAPMTCDAPVVLDSVWAA